MRRAFCSYGAYDIIDAILRGHRMDEHQVKDYFDKHAASWSTSPDELLRLQSITDMMGLKEQSVIADIGCGRGVMLAPLLGTNPKAIYAVDISEEMIRYAEQTFPDKRITFINGDVLAAKLPMLDCALLFNAYPHFHDKKALAGKLSEHVRPGGFAVIAHSRGREHINRIHDKRGANHVSVILRPAEEEAREFLPYFEPEATVDNDEMFFLKMVRV
jgi:demethylmenaquinone methyltransferase/2-methoxy-6-polyprenyl-1,4-benzoquinol methylase